MDTDFQIVGIRNTEIRLSAGIKNGIRENR